MSNASRVLRIFLAAVLLFSQQQAVLHLLGHDLTKLAQKETTDPQELVCAKCLAIAHLDQVVSGGVPTPASSTLRHERASFATPLSFDPSFVARYRSRAPPSFS